MTWSLVIRGINWGISVYRRFRAWLVALVILLTVIFTVQQFLWTIQKTNIFVRTDTVAYLWSAENLAKGIGIGRLDGGGNFVPYTHWPPMYPILLAGINLAGFSHLDAARVLGTVNIIAIIILVGLTVSRLTDKSPAYTAGALALMIFSSYFYETNYYAMTEPLYMVFSLSAILLLDSYLSNGKRWFLIFAAILTSLTLLTRYIGISLLVACVAALLLQKGSKRRIMLDCALLGGITLVPTIAWLVRNILVSGTAANRELSIYTLAAGELSQAGQNLMSLFSPLQTILPIATAKKAIILILTFFATAVYFRFAHLKIEKRSRFIFLIAIYSACYGVIMVAARVLFDPAIPLFEYRIQFPLVMGCFFLIIYGLYQLQVRVQARSWLAAAVLVSIYVLAAWSTVRVYQIDSISFTSTGHRVGHGFGRSMDNGLVSTIDQYPVEEYRFYSDDIEKLYFYSMYKINSYSTYSMTPEQFSSLVSNTSRGKEVVVLFNQRELGKQYLPAIPGMHLVYQGTADVYVSP